MTAPTDATQQRQGVPVAAAAPLLAPTTGSGLAGHAEALQSILTDVSTLTVSQLVQLFRQYQSQPDFPVVLREAFPEIVRPHAEAAAQITAQWYNELAPDSAFEATPVTDLPAERLTKTVDWSLYGPTDTKPAGEVNPDVTLDRLAGSSKRMVFDSSRSTVLENAQAEHVRWARYASATACAFCRVLATRGAVYSSEQAALKSHDHCRCVATPIRGGETWDPPAYFADWEKDYHAARDAGHASLKAIVAHMRANTNAR